MARIDVFYQETRGQRFEPYEPGNDLMKVAWMDNIEAPKGKKPFATAVAEVVYRQMNHVDGSELISTFRLSGLPLRSLSVGDVIRISRPWHRDIWMACEPMGWKTIKRPENI